MIEGSKIIGERWKLLSGEDKVLFEEQAKSDKERYFVGLATCDLSSHNCDRHRREMAAFVAGGGAALADGSRNEEDKVVEDV